MELVLLNLFNFKDLKKSLFYWFLKDLNQETLEFLRWLWTTAKTNFKTYFKNGLLAIKSEGFLISYIRGRDLYSIFLGLGLVPYPFTQPEPENWKKSRVQIPD